MCTLWPRLRVRPRIGLLPLYEIGTYAARRFSRLIPRTLPLNFSRVGHAVTPAYRCLV